MKTMDNLVPTLDEFLSHSREALSYLKDFGFNEIEPPAHRNNNPFQLWFKADKRIVIATGDGRGSSASISLEHEDGFELAEIYFVPEDRRPKSLNKKSPTQLEQVSQSARWLKEYGTDFLEGDLGRYFRFARPLPPYKISK
jgi:hypothetical protein